jgi:hypothetical protein
MPIDAIIFDLIRSDDVEERKRGVKALARTEDREALRYLASLYKQDPDPEVRDLALLAGQHIKKRSALADWGTDTGKSVEKLAPVEYKTDEPKKKKNLPADANTSKAKALLDNAMNFVMQSDYARAQDLAYEAFEIAPHIGKDAYYASIAAEIMGLPAPQAVKTLLEGQMDYAVGRKPKKSVRKSKQVLGWQAFLLDSVILFGISLVMEIMLRGYMYADMNPIDILASSGGSLLAIWVQFIMIHLAATSYLDGDGSFIDLFRAARLPLVLQSFIYILAFGYLSDAAPNLMANPEAFDPSALDVVWTFVWIVLAAYIGYAIWITIIISKTYAFNVVNGCGAIVFGNGLLWCFYCTLSQSVAMIFSF